MLSSLCYKQLYLNGLTANPTPPNWISGGPLWAPVDEVPLVPPLEENRQRRKSSEKRPHRRSLCLLPLSSLDQPREARGKSLPALGTNETSTGAALVLHLQHLIGGSKFTFRRFHKDEMEVCKDEEVVVEDDDDARTAVTYISLTNTCMNDEEDDEGDMQNSILMTRSAMNCLRRPEKSKRRRNKGEKRHVTWMDLQKEYANSAHATGLVDTQGSTKLSDSVRISHIPQPGDAPQETVNSIQLSYSQPSPSPQPLVPQCALPEAKRTKYKLQIQHIKRLIERRRYHKWFLTLYEFDSPPGGIEDPIKIDCSLFESLLTRLHGIYSPSVNKFLDTLQLTDGKSRGEALPCFKGTPLRLHTSPRKRAERLFAYSRFTDTGSTDSYISDESSTTSAISCANFSMFSSASPRNPGQLFCPSLQASCQNCGRNLTCGSSLASTTGSTEDPYNPDAVVQDLITQFTARQPLKMCYSMSRSAEFYRSMSMPLGGMDEMAGQPHRHLQKSVSYHSNLRKRELILKESTNFDEHRRPAVGSRSRKRSSHMVSEQRAVSLERRSNQPPAVTSLERRERSKKIRRMLQKRLGHQRVEDWLSSISWSSVF